MFLINIEDANLDEEGSNTILPARPHKTRSSWSCLNPHLVSYETAERMICYFTTLIDRADLALHMPWIDELDLTMRMRPESEHVSGTLK